MIKMMMSSFRHEGPPRAAPSDVTPNIQQIPLRGHQFRSCPVKHYCDMDTLASNETARGYPEDARGVRLFFRMHDRARIRRSGGIALLAPCECVDHHGLSRNASRASSIISEVDETDTVLHGAARRADDRSVLKTADRSPRHMLMVTGAAGFVGRQACRSLSAAGKSVLAVDRDFTLPPRCTLETGDLSDTRFVARLFESYPIDCIVHLASLLNTASREQPQLAMRVNVGVSLSLLEHAATREGCRLIYGSSISVYGDKPARQHGAVSEAEPAAPSDVYGASKRFVEIAGVAQRERSGLEFAALRMPILVGSGARATSSAWRSELFDALTMPERTCVSVPLAADELMPLSPVQDVAEMLVAMVEAPSLASSIYNAPCESWTGHDLAERISALAPHVSCDFGSARLSGIPARIDGRAFCEAFAFAVPSLEARLQAALAG
jgi:nucleoside-diphosphate-sugar epimerase